MQQGWSLLPLGFGSNSNQIRQGLDLIIRIDHLAERFRTEEMDSLHATPSLPLDHSGRDFSST